jgi:hypothetical protein
MKRRHVSGGSILSYGRLGLEAGDAPLGNAQAHDSSFSSLFPPSPPASSRGLTGDIIISLPSQK